MTIRVCAGVLLIPNIIDEHIVRVWNWITIPVHAGQGRACSRIGAGALALENTALVAVAGIRQDVGPLARERPHVAESRAAAIGVTAIGAATEMRAAADRVTTAIIGIDKDRVAVAAAITFRLGRHLVAAFRRSVVLSSG